MFLSTHSSIVAVALKTLMFNARVAHAESYDISTTSGPVRGFSSLPGVNAYLGIPFAEPPTGALRFAAPKPKQSSDSLIDATSFGASCFQVSYNSFAADKTGGTTESEDCLNINIWTPSNATSSLPVLIWLYGGGFSSGSNSLSAYNGQYFVAEQKQVVFASINYRVNAFGFPSSDAVPDKNVGLLDQRLGLEWLRDNIHAFGGDSSAMTLMGQSAGSISAAYMLFAYADDPIISASIQLSGQPGLLRNDDGSAWSHIANVTGCSDIDTAAELTCLRRVPARHLKRAISVSNLAEFTDPVFSPGSVVDNKTVFSADDAVARARAGQFAKLPLLIANTANEYDGTLPFTAADGVNHTLSDQLTLLTQHCPAAATAGSWIAQDIPVYRYVFGGIFPATRPYDWVRAYHGSDNALIFGAETRFAWEQPDETVLSAGRYLRDAVAAFLKDPVDGLKNYGWPKYTGQGKSLVRLFGENSASVAFEDPHVYDAPCSSLTP